MPPLCPLPIQEKFADANAYVESLLNFTASCMLFRTLCGGVHILDFLTREPDLYSMVLPNTWRDWFSQFTMEDILDLLMREDLSQLGLESQVYERSQTCTHKKLTWRGGPFPPLTLLDYIGDIRRHSLDREPRPYTSSFTASSKHASSGTLPRHIVVGMKPKKVHEVQNFAHYVDDLTADIVAMRGKAITHLVDFGSGQNYLGRALASQPYNMHIVAVESKQLNINGARSMDITAKLAKKEKIMRNKKQYRLERDAEREVKPLSGAETLPASPTPLASEAGEGNASYNPPANIRVYGEGKGTVQYVAHEIQDGHLGSVVDQLVLDPAMETSMRAAGSHIGGDHHESKDDRIRSRDRIERSAPNYQRSAKDKKIAHYPDQSLLVISLHSCGNLVHHGIRSLLLNSSVAAVALVGCCYNLVTERLGPPTYKLPILRPQNARLEKTSSANDAHGFPMSDRLLNHIHGNDCGVRLNITARMMAVQAPQNWTAVESDAFFTRHFFRAMLQRIFLDRGVVGKPSEPDDVVGGESPAGWSGEGHPIIIGSLRKACYSSFVAYVRGAVTKLVADPQRGKLIEERMKGLTDEEIRAYEELYKPKKKELSVVWSLMAFSAGVVEAVIVVDRWLFLKEHKEIVKDCWVEPVFDYRESPRNLVVVGIKR
ncbi:MAG: hypothetical protein M1827_000407 [Pycnora praestabilis]|nr:MAG: hypothetical protein M1827_000407 [Pycnora praestabilis]